MTPAGAKAYAKAEHDTHANPPVYAKIGSNGSSHNSVVHITYGKPKPVEKTDKNGNVLKVFTPERPRAHTMS